MPGARETKMGEAGGERGACGGRGGPSEVGASPLVMLADGSEAELSRGHWPLLAPGTS